MSKTPQGLEELRRFLKSKTLLGFLDDRDIDELLSSSSLRYFMKGSRLFEDARKGLYIIYRGAVKVEAEDGSLEFLEEGDLLGLDLLFKGRPSSTAEAVEDTVCLIVSEEVFWSLHRRHRSFAKLMELLLKGEAVHGHEEALPPPIRYSPLLYERRVIDVVRKTPVTCLPSTRVGEAARLMSENHVSSIVVVDEEGRPLGIVTDADLRRALASFNPIVDRPVEDFMSRPLVKVNGDAMCWEALALMAEAGVKYLPVIVEGRVAGVITLWDLSSSLLQAPVVLVRGIEDASSIHALRDVTYRVVDAVKAMYREGVGASHLAKMISSVYDRLVVKAIKLAEEELLRELSMHPPVKYAWIAMGSEGRREQLIKTDQDNALIYEDPPPGEEEVVDSYFKQLAVKVSYKLSEVGYPKCPHGFTADNPSWNKPLKEWLRDLHSWASTLNVRPEHVMLMYIFADARLVYGSKRLVDEFRDTLFKLFRVDKRRLQPLARNVFAESPPIGFLGRFVVQRDGAREKAVDIKLRGLNIVVNSVKVLSLDHGVEATNTLDRLEALSSKGAIPLDLGREASQAFNLLLSLRLREQLKAVEASKTLSPENMPSGRFIDLAGLSKPERVLLREAFKSIRKLQALVGFRYAGFPL